SSTVCTAATRPVKSSHWRTFLTSTWATLTSGGGGIAAPPGAAWLLQPAATAAATLAASAKATGRRRDFAKALCEFIRCTSWSFDKDRWCPAARLTVQGHAAAPLR